MINRVINLPKNSSFFLFGPRQTGKTTLLKHLFDSSSTIYYDLLKTDEYLRLASQPSLLREEVLSRQREKKYIVIDEIQRIPELLNEVHCLMESNNPPIFVLTGSSARKLKRSKADLLAGRALNYKLFPLTIQELGESFSLYRLLRFGTIPGIILENSEDIIMDKLRAYVETYLKEEIEIEAHLRRLDRFVSFLAIAAFSNGQIINYSNIARETATSYQTVKSYFQILEDTLIGSFLYPYLKSKRKRLSHKPKFYFFDLGIVRALTKRLTIPIEPKTPDFGQAFEHFIILEIMRMSEYQKRDYSFSYYHTESGAEVDLIIEKPNGEVLGLEIKATDIIDSSHLRGLRSFATINSKAKLFVVSTVPRRIEIGNVLVLPWQEILEWI